MTDAAYPVAAPGPNHSAAPPPPSSRPAAPARSLPPLADDVEDDGLISCLCGYVDDDGWTVACDSCNNWQHQLCYYPQFEEQPLPEDLQHYCVDCRPRPFDRAAAHARQRAKRDEQASVTNGVRRPPNKSHKKKVKEPAPPHVNGWQLDRARHERTSASPRDHQQPPPAKRPKTSHRPSDSNVSVSGKTHSRKRNASAAVNQLRRRSSPSRSPDPPVHLYSPEFVQRYRDDEWAETRTNLHDSIAISNSLSEWLTLPDDIFRDMHGHPKSEVLMRWDGELTDIPGAADLEIHEVTDERIVEGPLAYPTWKTVTVKEPVPSGAYIGELKGHVGFKDDYVRDPANRWALLNHPEPFVFFHPRLPIYIDARDEGTQLRYVRRSCNPNAHLQVLVTNQTDYRFCFMATQQIEPGMEIAVPWDTHNRYSPFGQPGADLDLAQLSVWVSNVLANCGPCACHGDVDCAMNRFDRRLVPGEEEPPPVKAPKSKSRKGQPTASPLTTQLNSRSGSEARKVDGDDEPTDSRSVSGSAGRGSASRDMTPNTHYSHSGSLSAMPELSERERKKLAKEEEMFRRQEEESRSGRQNKKKRLSAGTPISGANNSARQPSRHADASSGRPSAPTAARSSAGKRAKRSATPKIPKTITKVVPRPKPVYVDTAVQCDMDAEVELQRAVLPVRRRPFIPMAKRLLQRCALNNVKRKSSVVVDKPAEAAGDRMEIDSLAQAHSSPVAAQQDPEPVLKHEPSSNEDIDMKDADAAALPTADASAEERSAPDVPLEVESQPPPALEAPAASSSPTDPPGPPWPSQASHSPVTAEAPAHADEEPSEATSIPASSAIDEAGSADSSLHSHRPTDMRLDMPPPPSNPFAAATGAGPLSSLATPTAAMTGILSAGTPTTATSTFAQSPLSAATPLFPPSVAAAVAPSPARKKLSLSDYTRRSKAKDTSAGTGGGKDSPDALRPAATIKDGRESSPLSATVMSAASAPAPASAAIPAAAAVQPVAELPDATTLAAAAAAAATASDGESAVVDADGDEQMTDVKVEESAPAVAPQSAPAAEPEPEPAAVAVAEDPPAKQPASEPDHIATAAAPEAGNDTMADTTADSNATDAKPDPDAELLPETLPAEAATPAPALATATTAS